MRMVVVVGSGGCSNGSSGRCRSRHQSQAKLIQLILIVFRVGHYANFQTKKKKIPAKNNLNRQKLLRVVTLTRFRFVSGRRRFQHKKKKKKKEVKGWDFVWTDQSAFKKCPDWPIRGWPNRPAPAERRVDDDERRRLRRRLRPLLPPGGGGGDAAASGAGVRPESIRRPLLRRPRRIANRSTLVDAPTTPQPVRIFVLEKKLNFDWSKRRQETAREGRVRMNRKRGKKKERKNQKWVERREEKNLLNLSTVLRGLNHLKISNSYKRIRWHSKKMPFLSWHLTLSRYLN